MARKMKTQPQTQPQDSTVVPPVVKTPTVVDWLKEKKVELNFKPQNNMVIRGNCVVYEVGEIEYNDQRRQRVVIKVIIPTIFTDDLKRKMEVIVIEDIIVLGRYAETLKVQIKPGMVIDEFKCTTRTMGGKTVSVLNGFMRWKPTTKPGQIAKQAPDGEDAVVSVQVKLSKEEDAKLKKMEEGSKDGDNF